MKTLLFALFFSSMAFGQVSQVNIKNFNFAYQAPTGEGTADEFSYQKQIEGAQKVFVEKIGNDFKIKLEGVENQELELKNAPSLIKDAQKINLSAFNLAFTDKASLSLGSASFISPDKTLQLKSFALNCDRVTTQESVLDQVISGCVQKMSLKSSSFNSEGEGFDQAIMKAFDERHDEILGAVGIKNLELKMSAGKFELNADIKAQISGHAKGTGNMKYEPAAKKLTIKISEVKFGILDVTSQVFDELKKQESANVKVNKPYVYVTIK